MLKLAKLILLLLFIINILILLNPYFFCSGASSILSSNNTTGIRDLIRQEIRNFFINITTTNATSTGIGMGPIQAILGADVSVCAMLAKFAFS
jgi:hypothetical protein